MRKTFSPDFTYYGVRNVVGNADSVNKEFDNYRVDHLGRKKGP